ncbi:hypothetical protein F8M41_006060 [Gigaspora margarita]|uniref:Uncharacterized protein n=1 Tax=Gigaspora margarita TaxID=4874 RepID=A0A8H4A4E8_GIGMA|nr:hypothetical protein F8M41_006060 [Gigaspora margarita]
MFRTIFESSSKTLLLNNNLQEIISVGELSQSSLTSSRRLSPALESRIVSQFLSSPSRQQSPTRITSQVTTPSRQLSPDLESRVVVSPRTNAQNNFVPSSQLQINPTLTSSRML